MAIFHSVTFNGFDSPNWRAIPFFGSLKNLLNGDVMPQDFTFCHLKS